MWHNHNQSVSIGPGRKNEQWMRKIEQRMRKKWVEWMRKSGQRMRKSVQLTKQQLPFSPLRCSQGWDICKLAWWTEEGCPSVKQCCQASGIILMVESPRVHGWPDLRPFFPILQWPCSPFSFGSQARGEVWAKSCQRLSILLFYQISNISPECHLYHLHHHLFNVHCSIIGFHPPSHAVLTIVSIISTTIIILYCLLITLHSIPVNIFSIISATVIILIVVKSGQRVSLVEEEDKGFGLLEKSLILHGRKKLRALCLAQRKGHRYHQMHVWQWKITTKIEVIALIDFLNCKNCAATIVLQ